MASPTLNLTRRMVVVLAILLLVMAVLLFMLGLQIGSRYFSEASAVRAEALDSGAPAQRGAP